MPDRFHSLCQYVNVPKRLRQDKNGGAWCPKQQVMRGIKEWIEIDLKSLHIISAIQTQGRFGNGQGQEYVEEYKLEYWRPGMEKWIRYKDRTGSEVGFHHFADIKAIQLLYKTDSWSHLMAHTT